MKINHMNCTIELTKTEMKAAEKFGSEMYLNLREARQDNPNYRVKLVAPSKKVDHHKGLTVDKMKNYILKNDDEEQSKLKEFYGMRGLTPEGKKDESGCPVSYGELKQWFFMQYPECKEMHDSVNKIMEKVRKHAEAEKAAKEAAKYAA
jgi:hypothetical protein